MIKTNFHTHCSFCDGFDEAELHVKKALALGFSGLGFSSHAPVGFRPAWAMPAEKLAAYFAEIARLQRCYGKKIEIYTGLETDYYDSKECRAMNWPGTDYLIGAVHFLYDRQTEKAYSIVGSESEFARTVQEYFQGDVQSFVGAYYRQVSKMLRRARPDIAGHLDVIKQQNISSRYFSEQTIWYQTLVKNTLQAAAAAGSIVEVNTGGIMVNFKQELYPSPWILHECKKLSIPIILSSDAHFADCLDRYFNESRLLLKEIGYRKQRVLRHGHWQDVAL